MRIETDRLIIREFTMADANDLQEILGDEETMKIASPRIPRKKRRIFCKPSASENRGRWPQYTKQPER